MLRYLEKVTEIQLKQNIQREEDQERERLAMLKRGSSEKGPIKSKYVCRRTYLDKFKIPSNIPKASSLAKKERQKSGDSRNGGKKTSEQVVKVTYAPAKVHDIHANQSILDRDCLIINNLAQCYKKFEYPKRLHIAQITPWTTGTSLNCVKEVALFKQGFSYVQLDGGWASQTARTWYNITRKGAIAKGVSF